MRVRFCKNVEPISPGPQEAVATCDARDLLFRAKDYNADNEGSRDWGPSGSRRYTVQADAKSD